MRGAIPVFVILLVFYSLSLKSQVWRPCYITGQPVSLKNIGDEVQLRSDKLIIPVVFHVVLPEGVKGPSEIKINSQMDALNDNFHRAQSIHLIPSEFRSQLGFPNIEFCLASTTPEGSPTNGITRSTTVIPNIGQHIFSDGRQSVHYTILGGKDAWDTDKFLNIWIAEINAFAARSSFPDQGPPDEQGIVIDPDFVGKSPGNARRFSEGRTLVHEVGHFLNLQHPWLNAGCNEDDGLKDTPVQDGPYFGCVSPTGTRSCGSLDMVQNFMQFGDDPCLLYFTQEQAQMMRTILQTVRQGLVENAETQCKGSSEPNLASIRVRYDASRYRIFINGLQREASYHIQTYDIGGQLTHEFTISERYTADIQARFMPNGIYVVSIKGPSGTTQHKIAVFRP
ncbi:MAG: hypothetical protein GVX78_00375 [Bacteroidetes bacterium]|jgi:hypothetical protein|nr:hypothetical protein [Bacteroidota bacterium]